MNARMTSLVMRGSCTKKIVRCILTSSICSWNRTCAIAKNKMMSVVNDIIKEEIYDSAEVDSS